MDSAARLRTGPCPPRRSAAISVYSSLYAALLIAQLLPPAANAAGLPERQLLAITDVAVVDLQRDGPSVRRTVLIEAGRIVAVADPRTAAVPAAARRVDGRGRFLIPGLVDMHVHLFNNYSRRPPNDWAFALLLANGVTAVREMNADLAAIAQVRRWRAALDDGSLAAPRILAAGVAVQGGSVQAMQQQVDAAADAGADFIKVFSPLPAAGWPALRDAAKARHLPLAGHTPAQLPLLDAAANGLASNEHLMQVAEACADLEPELLRARRQSSAPPSAADADKEEARILRAFDARRCRHVAATLAVTGQVQVPTLVLPYAESHRDVRRWAQDPLRRYLRADEAQRWARVLDPAMDAQTQALARRRWAAARQLTGILQRAGVPLLAGTDAPMPGVYPGFALHEELALLVSAGLSPRQALRAATLAPAQFLGIAATAGSVGAGQRADLLLLDADPLRDIRHTRRIHAVVIDGRLLTRPDLDALLDAAARHERADSGEG